MTVAEVTRPVTVRKWLWLVGLRNPRTFTRGRAGGARKGQGLTAWLPGIRNGRGERKTAWVEIKQLDRPLDMVLPELVQARVRRTKDPFVARAFNPSPTPFPVVGFILTIRCTVCRLARLPVACSNGLAPAWLGRVPPPASSTAALLPPACKSGAVGTGLFINTGRTNHPLPTHPARY